MFRIRLVVSALVLCLLAMCVWVHNTRALEPIDEAFGIRLGSRFIPSSVPDTIIRGAPAYYFMPADPSHWFDFYFMQITPVTNLVHTISAVGKTDDLEMCRDHRANLMDSLTAKHGPLTESGPVHTAKFDLDYQVIVQADGNRVVGVFCGGTAPIIFELAYVDDELSDLAEEERRQVAREAKLLL